jgi:hypothetical protein
MFSTEELGCLDPNYFVIIVKNPYDVTIKSKNTGHYWYLHNPEYPTESSVVVYHKHRYSQPFHMHQRARSLRQAVKSIKSHDRWQMNGWKW